MNTLAKKIRGAVKRIKTWGPWITGRLLGVPQLRFYCPACDRSVWKWSPFLRNIGVGKNQLEPEGRLCPLCSSFERTRHFALYVEQEKLLENQPRMLHFAPERSLERRFRTRLGPNYLTTDLCMKEVDRHEDVTKMTFADNSFDVIYCSNVLEHVEADAAAMQELFRVLSPGGVAIIQVPIKGAKTYEDPSIITPDERYKHFGQSDHVRYYGEDIKGRLEAAGFEVTPFYMLDALKLAPKEVEKMNLGKRELVHRCTKA